MKYFVVFAGLILGAPSVFANVVINEIAWQGFDGDANNEWIELLNTGSSVVNLDGWLLESSDGTPSINLTGVSISSGAFVLLERTDDTSVPNVSGDVIYTGALANTGENLILKNADGAVVDSANFASGWTYPENMEHTLSRFGTSWNEGVPTPKASNEQVDGNENTDTENQEESDEEEESTASTASSSEESKPLYKTRKLTIESVSNGFIQVPIEFDSHIRDYDGGELRKGIYVWNMGDGTVLYKSKNEPFNHVYMYPGEYVVALSFNRNHFGKDINELEADLLAEKVVTVKETPIEFESVDVSGTFTLKNNSTQTIDLGGWKISNGDSNFFIPRRTMIRPSMSLTFHNSKTKLTHNPLSLFTPSGSLVGYGSHIVPKVATPQIQSEIKSSHLEQESVAEEVSKEEGGIPQIVASASTPIQQKTGTVYILLFILVAFLGSGVVWYVVSKEKNLVVDGYEIVEE